MIEGDRFDVAVVGAGPAGMMAAGVAAESGAKVILIEKNEELGKKLLLTGNGRCNITNAEFNLRKLVENYGQGGKFLFRAFSVFGPEEVIKFFNGLRVKTKIENNDRVFPTSEKATDVLNGLKKYLLKNKVNIFPGSQVSKIILKDNKIEKMIVGDKEIIAEKYIFCTGGKSYPITGSTGDGFKWASDLGHSISELSPALTPIKIKENWARDLQGLVLKDVKISILQDNKKHFKETGDILFTHFGLSGPLILDISKTIGELLKQGEVKLCLDLFPNLNIEVLDKKIKEKIDENPKKLIKSFLTDFMPKRFIPVFLKNSGLEGDKKINDVAKKERKIIARLLKNIEVTATELLGFDSAMVTRGGVSLKEIDDKTMRSKIIDNLFFSGEIIDIDGRTGGFNLQACWSTGYLAGKSAICKFSANGLK
ncbi:MAG: NAD(P)/FAD-dependent oxidoreductase [bacterium]|nr:NAD(P)/FAD-dependent oxidoreductase [bacterium]